MEEELIRQRKQKFRMALPILVLPFITLLFYSLGGGKGAAATADPRTSALSTTLPEPIFDENRPMDKLSLYQQAAKDSMDRQRDAAYDPFAAWMPSASRDNAPQTLPPAGKSPYSYPATEVPAASGRSTPARKPPPEEALEQKITQLEKMLQTPDTPPPAKTALHLPLSNEPSEELKQLEAMMAQFAGETPGKTGDPELAQMDGMLSKILDIQHPDRVKERLREQSLQNKGVAYALSTEPDKEISDLLVPSSANVINHLSPDNNAAIGFYDEDEEPMSTTQNAVAAVVHENQTLVSGATIKLRLQQNAYVQGELLPKGGFIYGTCSLNGERLEVSVTSIRNGHSIYPVSLIVYDLDGLPGLRIPGSINRDASKESTQQAMQTLSMGSLDPSIGAQATAAGIDAAKSLLTRKVRLVKVSVKAGYPLLLASAQNN